VGFIDTDYTGVVTNLQGFPFRSGRLCLDLSATFGGRYRGGLERLGSTEDLRSWLRASGLCPRPATLSERHLAAARELREAIYRLAHPSQKTRAVDVATVNRWAGLPPLAPKLAADGTATWDGSVEAALSTLARDAIDLLTGPLARRIRECARPDCSILFVDASRPGRRRWCSMERCGNRRKTAAYRKRKRKARRQRD
jgi:predicted RNA-binding Zn ribbon-like protein